MIDYPEKGKTIVGQYYASELGQLKEAIRSNRRERLGVGILLLQDNAPIHTALKHPSMALDCYFILRFLLTYFFLNSNPTSAVTILETISSCVL